MELRKLCNSPHTVDVLYPENELMLCKSLLSHCTQEYECCKGPRANVSLFSFLKAFSSQMLGQPSGLWHQGPSIQGAEDIWISQRCQHHLESMISHIQTHYFRQGAEYVRNYQTDTLIPQKIQEWPVIEHFMHDTKSSMLFNSNSAHSKCKANLIEVSITWKYLESHGTFSRTKGTAFPYWTFWLDSCTWEWLHLHVLRLPGRVHEMTWIMEPRMPWEKLQLIIRECLSPASCSPKGRCSHLCCQRRHCAHPQISKMKQVAWV